MKLLEYLFDTLIQLAEAYPIAVARGGEVIPTLQPALGNTLSKQITLQLLQDIAAETSRQLTGSVSQLICPRCLTHFCSHTVNLSAGNSITYYGCRICSQSRDFYTSPVVAVLDNQMADTPVQQDGTVRANWFTRRELFDFDMVEIVQVNDEDVERFAVQVGNDTDRLREPRYKTMQCLVHLNCNLSENSLRILQRMFGKVAIGERDDPTAGLPRHVPA